MRSTVGAPPEVRGRTGRATIEGMTSDDERDAAHRAPGTPDDVVDAVGAVTAAFEVIEHARGMLYAFHRLTGRADAELTDALDQLAAAGHPGIADELRAELVGRNVLAGRWTFQVVEEYDDTYYRVFQAAEKRVRDELTGGRRHVYEARLKEENRTHGRSGHEATP